MHRLNYSKTRSKKQNRNIDIELAEAVGKMVESRDDDTVIMYEDEMILSSNGGMDQNRQSSHSAHNRRKSKTAGDIRGSESRKRQLDYPVVTHGKCRKLQGFCKMKQKDKENEDNGKVFIKSNEQNEVIPNEK